VVERLTEWHARPGLDRQQAVRYWTEQHARLVERVPRLEAYVQHVAVVAPDGSEPPYAGLGEARFRSFEDAARGTESAEWAAVLEDARTFMDRPPHGRLGGEPGVVPDAGAGAED